jgi:hypothetical protein
LAQTETQVVAAELERVSDKVPVLFERDAMFYANVEKRPVEKVSARDMRVPLEIRPGGLFGYYDAAGGDLGRGEGPTFEKATVSTVNFKYAVEWHKKAQWATDEARKSVVSSVKHLLANSMKEFRRMVDSNLMTGGDGVIGTISAVSGTGPYTLTLGTDGFGSRLIRVGQKINIYSSTVATNRTAGDERVVTKVDEENKQIIVAGGVITGIVAGDKIVASRVWPARTRSASSACRTTTATPRRAPGSAWTARPTRRVRANRITASGGLALTHIRRALNKIGQRLGLENGLKATAWLHPCQIQAYEELGQAVTLLNKTGGGNDKLDLFFDVQQLAGVPARKHFNWDKTRIDFVVNEVWGRAEMKEAGFYEEEGRRLFEVRGPSGGVAAATLFYLVVSFNTFINNPPGCSYVSDLSVPTGY